MHIADIPRSCLGERLAAPYRERAAWILDEFAFPVTSKESEEDHPERHGRECQLVSRI